MTIHHLLDNIEVHIAEVRAQYAAGDYNKAYFHANEVQAVAFSLKNTIFREQHNSGEVK